MILILPQIQFEAIPSKDAGEVAFQSEADRSHKSLGFCHKSFSLVGHMATLLRRVVLFVHLLLLLPESRTSEQLCQMPHPTWPPSGGM